MQESKVYLFIIFFGFQPGQSRWFYIEEKINQLLLWLIYWSDLNNKKNELNIIGSW